MTCDIQITVRDMEHSAALDEHIRKKIAKLERLYSTIISCRAVAEAPHKHRQQGRQFAVRLDILVPGREIVVNREHDEDIYVALRDAFDAAGRQLDDYNRIRQGDVRAARTRTRGAVRAR